MPHDKASNKIILDMLFVLNEWMAFAKLRLHTDYTLELFDACTISLSQHMRLFLTKVCSIYPTVELPREESARGKRAIASAGAQRPTKAVSGPLRRYFNLNTYKFHSLGDYPAIIREFGTTDSYSTQIVSHERIFSPCSSHIPLWDREN